MKKILMLCAMLALYGCDAGEILCDPAVHPYNFYIDNQTDDEIVLSSDAESVEPVGITAGENKWVSAMCGFSYGCNGPEGIMPSNYYERDHAELVELYPDPRIRYHAYSMTIVGEPAPEGIWQPEHWVFDTPDKYTANYTLTVTDELLESLAAPEE